MNGSTPASGVSYGILQRERWISVLLFLLLLLSYTYTLPRWADPNQNSRLDMVVAVVDDGTFRIDKYVANTVDYARIDGHYYSDKAPGAAFLGIPVYAVLRQVLALGPMNGLMERLAANEALRATLREEGSGLLEHKVRFAIAQVAVTFVTAVVPSALLGVMMYRLLGSFTPQPWLRVLTVLGYALLTPAFAYAGAFYGHQLSAALLLGALYLVRLARRPHSVSILLAVGLLLGYSAITEYPTLLLVAIIFLYTFFSLEDKRRIGWVILSGGLVALGWMAYNTVVFGGPLTLGYSHSELWTEQHSTGFMSLGMPHWEAIWGITFSRFRGLFVLSPLLLLAVPGFLLWWRSGEDRALWWVAVLCAVSMFLFNAASVMWWGGYAVGPRYLLPALPFLALAMLFVLRAWGRAVWFRVVAAMLSLWSLAATWGLTLAEQAFPPDTIRNPLLEYALPNWRVGNIARNLGMFLGLPGILSLLPLVAGMLCLMGILWYLSHQQTITESRGTT